MGIFSAGTGKVQTYRTSRLHNDDIMNMNGHLSDNSMNESQKMMSQMQMDKVQMIRMICHTR